jgi:hypothetical protein
MAAAWQNGALELEINGVDQVTLGDTGVCQFI